MGSSTLIFAQKLCSFFLVMSLQLKNSRSESYIGQNRVPDQNEVHNLLKYTTQHRKKDLGEENFVTVERINCNSVATKKSLHKRAISAEDEGDDVFRQLEFELNVDNTERVQTAKEEMEESDKIFHELYEETSTAKSDRRGKDSETVQRITDTIARIVFRGRKSGSDNSNILRLISNVFNNRHRNS